MSILNNAVVSTRPTWPAFMRTFRVKKAAISFKLIPFFLSIPEEIQLIDFEFAFPFFV